MSELEGTNLIAYSFPLRKDCIVHLVLPKDLAQLEVVKIEQFLKTLVTETDTP